ncbi:unnamed protein product [Calypogeia fissa]
MTRQRQHDWSGQPAIGGGGAVVQRAIRVRSGAERQESQKSASVTGSSMPATILVDDDDDDVHISSPRGFHEARSLRGRADLELRLGPSTQPASLRSRVPGRQAENNKPRDRNASFTTIDLTAPSPAVDNDDCILVNEFVQKKRKPAQPAYEPPPPEPAKELKLTCAICMDSMKEETSTICGHIFCRKCIVGAIAVQKKCPTCRQTLTNKQTHRIYISASLKNS